MKHNNYHIRKFEVGTTLSFQPLNLDGSIAKLEYLKIGAQQNEIWREGEQPQQIAKPTISYYHGWVVLEGREL
jgi:hypothetical protein